MSRRLDKISYLISYLVLSLNPILSLEARTFLTFFSAFPSMDEKIQLTTKYNSRNFEKRVLISADRRALDRSQPTCCLAGPRSDYRR
jgi:hypothetical protein